MTGELDVQPSHPLPPVPLGADLSGPYAEYAALRQAAPVHRVVLPDGATAWVVTRYADVRAALADPRLSMNKANGSGAWKGFSLPGALDANLANMDPPDHTRIRRLVSQAFTPQRVEKLRPAVQAVADELVDRMAPAGRADLVAEYAVPLPVAVICDLLGVPQRDRADLRDWTEAMTTPPPDDPTAAVRAVRELAGFMVRLIAEKRRDPGDDLISAMIAARDGVADDAGTSGGTGTPGDPATAARPADRLGEDELTSLAFVLLFAGYENSVHAIGTGLLALLRHPEQLAAARRHEELPVPVVEELLRYEPPGPLALRRFPLVDMAIGGVTIPARETVLLGLAAANRDPDRFPDAEELDVARPANPHLTLGHGIHYCVGAPLARMELQIAIGTLLRRFPGLALAVPAEELTWRPSYRSRALRGLPVRF
ncbi:cytochrome P450 [Micromonospora sp. NPDC049559]|uniref:cytochrome P450 family protein n=1 Tax=Micromonospora sp. NPDC049559 TaxID=3155923 RepID=UPI00342B5AFD